MNDEPDMWKNMITASRKTLQHVVCFLLGNSPVSEFYMPTFWNTLFHLHTYPPMKMEQTVFRNVGT